MKKTLLTACAIIFTMIYFSNKSHAQLEARAGLVFSSIKYSFSFASGTSDTKLGPQLGLTYSMNINDKFAFRPGLMYTMKGGTYSDSTEVATSRTLGYIGVPLDLVYQIPISENMLSFHFGPYFDYLIHSSDFTEDDLISLEYGINTGIGFGFGKFGIGVNFSSALSNFTSNEIKSSAGSIISFSFDETQSNRYTSIYLTYKL